MWTRAANQQAVRPSMLFVHRDPRQEKRHRGKTFSLLPRGMLSLFSAYQFLNASTRRNMRPFEIWKISSWSRKHWLSSDTGFQPQNSRKKGENIVYRFHNLLIALDLIAVFNWEVEVRGDVLDCRSLKVSPVPHLEKVRIYGSSRRFFFWTPQIDQGS